MAAADKAAQVLADYQDQLVKLDQVKANVQSKIDLVSGMLSDMAAEVQAAHDQGVLDGKAMIQLPNPADPAAQYTQQQMSDAVSAGVKQVTDQLQPQIDQLNTDKAAAQSSLDKANADLANAKQMQADLQAKVDAEQADADKLAQIKAILAAAQ